MGAAGLYLRARLARRLDPVLLWSASIAVDCLCTDRSWASFHVAARLAACAADDGRRSGDWRWLITFVFERLAIQAGGGRFVRWLFNTALLSVIRAFVMVIFCSMAAYAFARMRFPGKNLIFNFMLASMMIPGAVTLMPDVRAHRQVGLDEYCLRLIFPSIVNAFGIFMLTQFLKSVPRELEEAAFIDGASYFQIYKDVVLPLARPALLTLFILQFQGMWNDFLPPLLYLNTPDMWVMNVALSVFQQQYKAQWNLTLVGAMINAVVPLTMFFFFSRYYIQGVSYEGIKG